MDKTTKAYIESIISPIISRIQSLQTANEVLRNQVRHLQQIVNNQPSYSKPTLSASQHMRQSRISSSSRISEKKPSWNNNPKYESPSKPTNNEASHEKIKTKPPIPKIVKSPAKPINYEIKNTSSQKKISGGTKFTTDNDQAKQINQTVKQIAKKTECIHQEQQKKISKSDALGQFQQLAKKNYQLLVEMKQGDKKQPAVNYLLKAGTPKSEYNNSKSASPNCRSFISQSDNKKLMEATKVNIECGLATMEIN